MGNTHGARCEIAATCDSLTIIKRDAFRKLLHVGWGQTSFTTSLSMNACQNSCDTMKTDHHERRMLLFGSCVPCIIASDEMVRSNSSRSAVHRLPSPASNSPNHQSAPVKTQVCASTSMGITGSTYRYAPALSVQICRASKKMAAAGKEAFVRQQARWRATMTASQTISSIVTSKHLASSIASVMEQ